MLKLEHISIADNRITCDVFLEDCETPIKASIEKSTGDFLSDDLPIGYEWCRVHLAYAKRALQEMIESGETKKQLTIMWY